MMENTEAMFGDIPPLFEQDPITYPYPPTNISTMNCSMENPQLLELLSSMSHLMEKQNQEVDQYLQIHNGQLRASLDQQGRQHSVSLLNNIVLTTSEILKQKDDEVASTYTRMQNLQEYLKNMIEDCNAWRRIALEEAAMVDTLNCTLEQIQQACSTTDGAEGRASCLGAGQGEINPIEGSSKHSIICRSCGSPGASMLFLPCRHLCACKQCEAFLVVCPICESAKTGALQVLLE